MIFYVGIFIISVIGLIYMLQRKQRLISLGLIDINETTPSLAMRLEEFRRVTAKFARGFGFFLLVEMIRLYVKLAKVLSAFGREIKSRIQAKLAANKSENGTAYEPNKFLKVIADSKKRISRIKKKIQEEEME